MPRPFSWYQMTIEQLLTECASLIDQLKHERDVDVLAEKSATLAEVTKALRHKIPTKDLLRWAGKSGGWHAI